MHPIITNLSINIKKMLPVGVSAGLLTLLFFFYDIDSKLISVFDFKLFFIFIFVAISISTLGSVRLHFNLKPFYHGIYFGTVHKINVYSMLSGLFFAGIIGSTVTKITLPTLSKVNKNLFIIISVVEKIMTIGIIFLVGVMSYLILNKENLNSPVQYENGFDLFFLIGLLITGGFCFFRRFIKELFRVIAAFFLSTFVYSLIIVVINLVPVFLILNNLLEISIAEKVLYSALLMFAGSLPISFQGIGVREAAAVYFLSQYNIDTSILVGNILMVSFSSVIAISIMPLTIRFFPIIQKQYKEKKDTIYHSALKYIENNLGLISIPCIIFCLFEVRIKIFQAQMPIALGDFFAVILFFILIGSIINKRIDPVLKQLYYILFGILFYFFISFLYGWYNHGFSTWALSNRLFGGLVLLGYIQAGFLFIRLSNELIKKTLLFIFWIFCTYLSVFLFINFLQLFSSEYFFQGFFDKFYTIEFLGSGAHPITFAFMSGFIVIFFYIFYYMGTISKRFFIISLLVLSISIGFTQSIFGILSIIFVSLFWLLKDKKVYWSGALAVVVGITLFLTISYGIVAPKKDMRTNFYLTEIIKLAQEPQLKEKLINGYSIWQESGELSFELLKQNWVMGSGLGATLNKFTKHVGETQLLYNTISLYLADTGVFGVLLIGSLFYWVYSLVDKKENKLNLKIIFWSVIIYTGTFSISHEISYQRFFWIWMGLFVSLITKDNSGRGVKFFGANSNKL